MLVSNFAREVASYVEGTPDENGIHQAMRPLKEVFLSEIRDTVPKFSPFLRGQKGSYTRYKHPEFLPSDGEPEIYPVDEDAICVDEVTDMENQ